MKKDISVLEGIPVVTEVNKYDSRWYSVRSQRNGRVVARAGVKVDDNGAVTEKSDTREFDTADEAMEFVSKFLGY